jgi:hypothetical protein
MIKQLSLNDNNLPNDFIDNSERILKDITKVLQTSITTLQSIINEYQLKEKEFLKETTSITETSLIDSQEALILDQKDSLIVDLTTKYEDIVKILNEIKKKNQEESE